MFERLKHLPLANNILRRPPGFYGAARRLLKRVDSMNADEREAFQAMRITRVLNAARALPGYANTKQGEDLSSWPLLTKSQISGHENEFVATSILPVIPASTGGTTGQPMRLARSWRSISFEQAVIDHLCASRGIEPSQARIAILRGNSIKPADDMKPPFWIDEGQNRRIFSAHHLNRDTICNFKAALRSYEPDILFCYPSSLASLLELIGEDTGVKIPLIFSSSEMLSKDTIARARAILGSDVIDFYGHAERIACAWSLNGGGYRFLPAYGHIELVPEAEGLARIVATSLSSEGQIFVRYETGDLIRVPSHDPDLLRAIALGDHTFEGIYGRDSEYIELADGRRIIGLNHIPRGVEGAASVQLHHIKPNEIQIYVAPGQGFSRNTIEAILSNFSQKFPRTVVARITLVERAVRQKNGKAPLLLRAPDPASIVPSKNQSIVTLEYVA